MESKAKTEQQPAGPVPSNPCTVKSDTFATDVYEDILVPEPAGYKGFVLANSPSKNSSHVDSNLSTAVPKESRVEKSGVKISRADKSGVKVSQPIKTRVTTGKIKVPRVHTVTAKTQRAEKSTGEKNTGVDLNSGRSAKEHACPAKSPNFEGSSSRDRDRSLPSQCAKELQSKKTLIRYMFFALIAESCLIVGMAVIMIFVIVAGTEKECPTASNTTVRTTDYNVESDSIVQYSPTVTTNLKKLSHTTKVFSTHGGTASPKTIRAAPSRNISNIASGPSRKAQATPHLTLDISSTSYKTPTTATKTTTTHKTLVQKHTKTHAPSSIAKTQAHIPKTFSSKTDVKHSVRSSARTKQTSTTGATTKQSTSIESPTFRGTSTILRRRSSPRKRGTKQVHTENISSSSTMTSTIPRTTKSLTAPKISISRKPKMFSRSRATPSKGLRRSNYPLSEHLTEGTKEPITGVRKNKNGKRGGK